MFLDTNSQGGGFWGPSEPICKRCKNPIAANTPSEDLHFDHDPEHQLHELNGTYHAACAAPLLSVKRAMDMLSRSFF